MILKWSVHCVLAGNRRFFAPDQQIVYVCVVTVGQAGSKNSRLFLIPVCCMVFYEGFFVGKCRNIKIKCHKHNVFMKNSKMWNFNKVIIFYKFCEFCAFPHKKLISHNTTCLILSFLYLIKCRKIITIIRYLILKWNN